MEIYVFYDFNKRRRSTKRPSNSAGTSIAVTLKHDTSIVNPTFTFRGTLTAKYDYVYVGAWDMYYFVEDIVSTANNLYELICKPDPLAILRDVIFNTNAFVVKSTSHYSAMLNDERVSQLEGRIRTARGHVSPFVTNPYNGTFLLATASMDNGISIIACNATQFYGIVGGLIAGGATTWESLQKLFGGAMGGLIGCRYCPIDISYWQGTNHPVLIGNYDTGTTAEFLELAQAHFTDEVELDIPWIYDDFRRNSNYTRVYLELPFIGVVDISSESLYNRSKITLKVEADGYTGVINYGVYTVTDSAQEIMLTTYGGTFGRQVPIANGQVDTQGFFNAMLSAGENLAGAVLFKSPAKLAQVALDTVDATVSANKKDFTVVGGFGGGYGEQLTTTYRIIVTAVDSRIEPSELQTLYGRPCNKVLRIGDLTGYVQTAGVALDCGGFSEVKEEAETLLNGGVYLE